MKNSEKLEIVLDQYLPESIFKDLYECISQSAEPVVSEWRQGMCYEIDQDEGDFDASLRDEEDQVHIITDLYGAEEACRDLFEYLEPRDAELASYWINGLWTDDEMFGTHEDDEYFIW